MAIDKRKLAYARRYIRVFGVLSVFLLIPIAVILLLNNSEQRFQEPPIYGPKLVNSPGDTTYHHIPDFQFTSHYGEPFTEDSLRGKIHIADFIFTNCPGICPMMSASMQEVVNELQEKFPEVIFVSYTIDPANDTVPALQAYAQRYDAPKRRWYFVRADSASQVYKLAQEGYFMSAGQSPEGPEDGFFHDNRFAVVDQNLRIRGYFQGITDDQYYEQTKDLVETVQVLVYKMRKQEEQD